MLAGYLMYLSTMNFYHDVRCCSLMMLYDWRDEYNTWHRKTFNKGVLCCDETSGKQFVNFHAVTRK